MKTAAYTGHKGRVVQACMPSTTRSADSTDPRDGVLGHRRPAHLSEVRADLPGRQPLGVQRQDDRVDLGQPPLRFLTITGSKVPSRSRGTTISTGPALSVSTVLVRRP